MNLQVQTSLLCLILSLLISYLKLLIVVKLSLAAKLKAHLAIDRLKAHEVANAAILEAKQRIHQSLKQGKSPNRFAVLEVEHDIEEISSEVVEESTEDKSQEMPEKECAEKGEGPQKGQIKEV